MSSVKLIVSHRVHARNMPHHDLKIKSAALQYQGVRSPSSEEKDDSGYCSRKEKDYLREFGLSLLFTSSSRDFSNEVGFTF